MATLDIILLGYMFNILMIIFSSVFYTIYIGFKYDKVKISVYFTEIQRYEKQIKEVKQELIKNKINPLKPMDFILLVPFGHGFYLLNKLIISISTNNLFYNLLTELENELIRLDKLKSSNNV